MGFDRPCGVFLYVFCTQESERCESVQLNPFLVLILSIGVLTSPLPSLETELAMTVWSEMIRLRPRAAPKEACYGTVMAPGCKPSADLLSVRSDAGGGTRT